jgi:hypothetical protein
VCTIKLSHSRGSLHQLRFPNKAFDRPITSPVANGTEPMVVDTVDGKKLAGYVSCYFIAKTRQDSPVAIKDVQLLSVKASS